MYGWMGGWLSWFRGDSRENDRLRQWRTAWAAAADAPSRAAAAELREALTAIGIDDDEHEIEREMLEGLDESVELQERLAAGAPPAVETGHRAVGSDACYFSAPATLPDDPAQPSGTLLMTRTRAIFVGGARSVLIPWHGVGVSQRQDRDLLLIRADRQDLHRLRLNTFGDALQAALLARHFSTAASRRRI
jgi:hypothetical protein